MCLTRADAGVSSLSFLSGVGVVTGYLRIQDCAALPSLDELSSLTRIGAGLFVRNNDLLTDVQVGSQRRTVPIYTPFCCWRVIHHESWWQGLRNVRSIDTGGVEIAGNQNLCYANLFNFQRIVPTVNAKPVPLPSFHCTVGLQPFQCHYPSRWLWCFVFNLFFLTLKVSQIFLDQNSSSCQSELLVTLWRHACHMKISIPLRHLFASHCIKPHCY